MEKKQLQFWSNLLPMESHLSIRIAMSQNVPTLVAPFGETYPLCIALTVIIVRKCHLTKRTSAI